MELLEPELTKLIVSAYDGDIDETLGTYHGSGLATLDNQISYDGEFNNGIPNGSGLLTWPDGVVYEGEFNKGEITGQGIYRWPDGSSYTGQVLNGKRHGMGKFIGSGGQEYEGAWLFGLRSGEGKMIYNYDKTIYYTGSWLNGVREGYGTMRYASGNVYEGFWANDKKSGLGVMVWKDVDEVYTGMWLNDKCHGQGEHIWGDGGNSTGKLFCNMFRGSYENGVRCGRGTFFYADGTQYTGYWKDNLKDGEGTFIQTNGMITRGKYSKDRNASTDQIMESKGVNVNVNVQINLNIEDLFLEHSNPFSNAGETAKDVITSCERLLLRFHSQLKFLYKRYGEIANKKRVKTKDEATAGLSVIENKIYTNRNIHKRIYCMNIKQFKLFALELGVIDYSFSHADILKCFLRMKAAHKEIAKEKALKLVIDDIRLKYQNISISLNENMISKLKEEKDALEKKIVRQLELTKDAVQEIKLEIEELNKQINELNKEAENKKNAISPEEIEEINNQIIYFYSQDTYSYYEDYLNNSLTEKHYLNDSRQPLRESDFFELLVRVAVEFSKRQPSSPNAKNITPGIYESINRFLSHKIYPLYKKLSSAEVSSEYTLSIFNTFYLEEASQAMILRNESCFRKMFNHMISQKSNSQNPVIVHDALTFFEKLKPIYIIEAPSFWSLLRIMGRLPELPPMKENPPTTLIEKEEDENKITNEQTDDNNSSSNSNNNALADHPNNESSICVDNNDNQAEQKEKDDSIVEIRKKKFSRFPSLSELKSSYYDPTCLMRSIEIDDFIEMFIRVTKSEIWRSEEERNFLALQNRPVPLSEGEDAKVKVIETENTVAESNENSDPNADSTSSNVQTINSFQYQPLNNPEYINWINKFLNNDDFMRLFN